jgi:ActR/RegA family two-component response regulator
MDAKVLLVVDDDEPDLTLLGRVLRSRGVASLARAFVSRDLELRRAAVLLDLQVAP